MNGTALRVAIACTVVAAMLLPGTVTAKPSTAPKCAAAKQQAAGKSSACQLKCTANAALKGLPATDPVLVACLGKCRTKLASVFAKLEGKGGCDPAGNALPVAGKVDACALDIADDLQPGGGSPSCTVPFRADARDIFDGFTVGLDAAGNLSVPASCGGSVPVCCQGGSPTSPCGPLQFDFVPQGGEQGMIITVPVGLPDYVDADIPVRLKTLTDLPVKIPVVGDCGMKIDTTAGASKRVDIVFRTRFSADRLRMGNDGSLTVTLNGLESDDFAVTGGIGCQLANVGLGLFVNTLTNTIQNELLAPFANLCRRCCSGAIAQCTP